MRVAKTPANCPCPDDDTEFAGIMLDILQPVVKILPDIFEKEEEALKYLRSVGTPSPFAY